MQTFAKGTMQNSTKYAQKIVFKNRYPLPSHDFNNQFSCKLHTKQI